MSAVYDCTTSSDHKGGFQCHTFTTAPLYKDVAWKFQCGAGNPIVNRRLLCGGRLCMCVGVSRERGCVLLQTRQTTNKKNQCLREAFGIKLIIVNQNFERRRKSLPRYILYIN